MSLKTDFKQVLQFKDSTPSPYSIKFTEDALTRVRKEFKPDFDPILDTGTYVVASHTNSTWQKVDQGIYRDYFGVIWDKRLDTTLGIVTDPLLKSPSLKGFTVPEPLTNGVFKVVEKNAQLYPEHFHMLSIGFSLFERAWSLTGIENLMLYLLTEPSFVNDLLDMITEYNCGLIDHAKGLPVDCVHFGDDWGAQNGTLIDPNLWREFIKPRFSRMCASVKKAGFLVSLHSCGAVETLIPDMIECGVDVFDPFQPEAMDIWKIREKYRNKIAFWGGLSVQKTLPLLSEKDVREQTENLLANMAPGGGYILAPSHSITGDIPVKNILAFLEVARKQGKR